MHGTILHSKITSEYSFQGSMPIKEDDQKTTLKSYSCAWSIRSLASNGQCEITVPAIFPPSKKKGEGKPEKRKAKGMRTTTSYLAFTSQGKRQRVSCGAFMRPSNGQSASCGAFMRPGKGQRASYGAFMRLGNGLINSLNTPKSII
jgi:hypothetical protein